MKIHHSFDGRIAQPNSAECPPPSIARLSEDNYGYGESELFTLP